MNPATRRGWLLGAVAAAAASGGAWLALRKPSRLPEEAAASVVPAGFWSLKFDRPEGGSLELASFRGRPLLLNFWATWCPPCIDELPLLSSFQAEKAANGWQVVGLAVDQPSAVRTFLQRMPLKISIGLAGLEGTELSRSLGNISGGLPFTVLFGTDGRVLARRMGRLTDSDLEKWAKAVG